MAKRKGFGARPASHASAQQAALIVVSILALVFMITTLVGFNKSADMMHIQNEQRAKLEMRLDEELSAIGLLLTQQENESGEAQINTLDEIKKHIYAADMISVYMTSAYNAEPIMTTEMYSQLKDLVNQSITQLQSGNQPSAELSEFAEVLTRLREPDE